MSDCRSIAGLLAAMVEDTAFGNKWHCLAAATSDLATEDLDRVNPMRHGVPHTGWQVVASMAQHDAWHAGQISMMRDAYAALAPKSRRRAGP